MTPQYKYLTDFFNVSNLVCKYMKSTNCNLFYMTYIYSSHLKAPFGASMNDLNTWESIIDYIVNGSIFNMVKKE